MKAIPFSLGLKKNEGEKVMASLLRSAYGGMVRSSFFRSEDGEKLRSSLFWKSKVGK